MPRRRFGPRSACTARRGAVTLEFIVALPVLLIILLAVVEFGMFFSGIQQVNLASRAGAEAASQAGALPTSGLVPPSVTDAINQQLSSSGVSYSAVILEHNVPAATYTLTTPYPLTTPYTPPSTTLPLVSARSVRVTVYVPMSELAPNCLTLFRIDLATRYAQCSTTFRYELSTP